MHKIVSYLLWTVGIPVLIIAVLNIGLFLELWKLLRAELAPPEQAVAQEIGIDQIRIPKIDVEAPLLLSQHDPTAPWEDIRKDLENGVSLAPGLARPGGEGTVWITGHSSDYVWRPGSYKTVFALLPGLAPGDLIFVDYQETRFIYRVTGNIVVSPTNVAAFENRGGRTLTLMTCYPPLTTSKRWLVYAEQVMQ